MKKIAFLFCIMLSACGGGGGGGGGNDSGGSAYSISADDTSLEFSLPRDSNETPPEQIVNISFKGDGLIVGYPPGVSEPDWLSIETISSDSNSAQFKITMNSFTVTPSTTFTTTIRFLTGKADGSVVESVDVRVRYRRTDILKLISENDLELLSIEGGDTLNSQFEFEVETSNLDWELSSDVSWLNLSATSGDGPAVVTGSIEPNDLLDGEYTGTLTLSRQGGDVTDTKQVTLYVDKQRHWFGKAAMAVSHFQGDTSTSEPLNVSSNGALGWDSLTAISDSAWLTISKLADTFEIDIDSASLSAGQYIAKIQLLKNGVAINSKPDLVVGLYKSDSAKPAIATLALDDFYKVIVDPVRPVIYAHLQFSSTVQAYNIYTGETQTVISGDTLTQNYPVQISSDGMILYVPTPSNATDSGVRIRQYDIEAETWLADLPEEYGFVRVLNYHGALIYWRTWDTTFFDGELGTEYTSVSNDFSNGLVNSRLHTMDNGTYFGAYANDLSFPFPSDPNRVKYEISDIAVHLRGGIISSAPIVMYQAAVDFSRLGKYEISSNGRHLLLENELVHFDPESGSFTSSSIGDQEAFPALPDSAGNLYALQPGSLPNMALNQYDPDGTIANTTAITPGPQFWAMFVTSDEEYALLYQINSSQHELVFVPKL